ncbi:spore germination protein KC/spore germination protein [Clostridium acetobutylicum]|uniref:Spore germination protein, GRKC n=1 Tax=Clostridium acetobutylicum (strain ATCC 824 / DSM 792 / JCM 1419 / IAM 19013 / LMG 5710 / NBRC 13948 / NRRL B-527 / VKM B-1787 / 2291 / W) TaxID=272562 RepID=Q97TS8_CLOAB|nr:MULTISPECIES: Ger(x)C family spore germination protein [Clostridium]AAK76765.1 Spore germination protein, GRKC [Clostridium acetobutylicum ATCC 824]ADZ22801.1 Spore germination protein, GRKC [Clostridium acetobutylicum EA 2018]AEI34761.1 spore germination protein, GRKC [Clostridium acetobutylicum DSM 1731]AWV82310.1 Ger(x)C family spore germination protein [Clostridium acetobutylicum]MBC2396026.1 Ger(x)C family spore germination protein [Clostridium acetobutylicum]
MKSCRKKFLKIISCILIAVNLTSCIDSRELNKLAIVLAVGIDKLENCDDTEMTIQLAKLSSNKSGSISSGGSAPSANNVTLNLTETGNGLGKIVKTFNRKLDRQLFFSHNQVIVLGESAAKSGIAKYLDFFMRYRETRLLVWLLITKSKVKDILSVPPNMEDTQGRNLAELISEQKEVSEIPAINLKDFTERIMSKTSAPIIPIVEISTNNSAGTKALRLTSTAVFKKDKMIGTLDSQQTRGLLWALNKVKTGVVPVNLPGYKGTIDVETIHSKGKIAAKLKDNKLIMKINIKQEGNLLEQNSSENLATPDNFKVIEKAEEETIKKQIEAAILKSRDLNADIFGFGDAIYRRHPKYFKKIEPQWNKTFKNLNIEVNVNCKLRRNGRISKPIMAK